MKENSLVPEIPEIFGKVQKIFLNFSKKFLNFKQFSKNFGDFGDKGIFLHFHLSFSLVPKILGTRENDK
jgi:hypothetical protein